jgi:hypothetical protein
MAMFNNASHGGKISNSVTGAGEHGGKAAEARLRMQYFIGFGVVAVIIGVLIGLSVLGVF